MQLEQYRPKADKYRGHEGRLGRRITGREFTSAVGSATAVDADQLGRYRPKADKQRRIRAVGSTETEAFLELGSCRPEAERQ